MKRKEDDEDGDDRASPPGYDQVSIILGPNFIISFKEKEVDVFNPLRIGSTAKGRVRKQGADYLAYSMIDAIVDHYFLIMEKLGERFEDLEDMVVANPRAGIPPTIYNLRICSSAKVGPAAGSHQQDAEDRLHLSPRPPRST